MAALFAATYPERTRALVLYGTYAKRSDPADGLPVGADARRADRTAPTWSEPGAGLADIGLLAPSADDALARLVGDARTSGASPGGARD